MLGRDKGKHKPELHLTAEKFSDFKLVTKNLLSIFESLFCTQCMVLFPIQDLGDINHALLPHTIFNLSYVDLKE